MASRTAHAALIALACVAWQPAAAQRKVTMEGTYVHVPARAHFPERVGEFQRGDIYQYDPGGRDVSASYNLATPAGRLLITVYIYPAAAAAEGARAARCEEEFGSVNSAISGQNGNSVPLEQGPAHVAAGAEPGLGHRSVYRFSSPFGDRIQELRSEAHLYCYVGGDWFVKYRVSAPVAVESRAAVQAFIRDGPWPGRTSA
jgi:hypothetical protein